MGAALCKGGDADEDAHIQKLAAEQPAPPAVEVPAHPLGKAIVDEVVSEVVSSASSKAQAADVQSQHPSQLQALPVDNKPEESEDVAEKMMSPIQGQVSVVKNSGVPQDLAVEENSSKQAASLIEQRKHFSEPAVSGLGNSEQVEKLVDAQAKHISRECVAISDDFQADAVEKETIEHSSVDAKAKSITHLDEAEEMLCSNDSGRLNELDEAQQEKMLPDSPKADTDVRRRLSSDKTQMIIESCDYYAVPADALIMGGKSTPAQEVDRLSSKREANPRTPDSSADPIVAHPEHVVLEGVDESLAMPPNGHHRVAAAVDIEEGSKLSERELRLNFLPNDSQSTQDVSGPAEDSNHTCQASFLEDAVHEASRYTVKSKSSKSKAANKKKASKGKKSKKQR